VFYKNLIKNDGFTLVEMLVVLAVLAILLSLVSPNISMIAERASQVVQTMNAKTFQTNAIYDLALNNKSSVRISETVDLSTIGEVQDVEATYVGSDTLKMLVSTDRGNNWFSYTIDEQVSLKDMLGGYVNAVNLRWERVDHSTPDNIKDHALSIDDFNSLTQAEWLEILQNAEEVTFAFNATDSEGNDITWDINPELSIVVTGTDGTESVVFPEETSTPSDPGDDDSTTVNVGNFLNEKTFISSKSFPVMMKEDNKVLYANNTSVSDVTNLNFLNDEFAQAVLSSTDGGFIGLKPNGEIIVKEIFNSSTTKTKNNIPVGNDFVQITKVRNNGIALKNDGSITVWGDESGSTFLEAPQTNDFKRLMENEVDSHLVFAIKQDGSLFSWGDDIFSTSNDTPENGNFTKVWASRQVAAAQKEDGTVVVWGDNSNGLVDNFPTDIKIKDLSIDSNKGILAVKENGSLLKVGTNNAFINMPFESNFEEVFLSSGQAYALNSNGEVIPFIENHYNFDPYISDIAFRTANNIGYGASGSYTPPPISDSDVIVQRTFMLFREGNNVKMWGIDSVGFEDKIDEINQIEKNLQYSRSSYDVVLGLGSEGEIITIPQNSYSENSPLIINKPTNTGYKKIITGDCYNYDELVIAIKDDGSLVGWGEDSIKPELLDYPAGNGYIDVIFNAHSAAALNEDGSIDSWGEGPFIVPEDRNNFKQIAIYAGNLATLNDQGEVELWGRENYMGRFGNNLYFDIPTEKNIVKISSSLFGFLALSEDGKIFAVGNDSLGTGSIEANAPTGNNFIDIKMGNNNGYAKDDTGKIYLWGKTRTDILEENPYPSSEIETIY
jgi:prepilin-type N-terminal cleavage/methylation domain-containing protein